MNNKSIKKFLEVFNTSDWEVETESGWADLKSIGKTIEYDVWELILENGNKLKGADNHIVISSKNNKLIELFLCELNIGDNIVTKTGLSKVTSIKNLGFKDNMYDIEINSDSHTYYTNNILSHNSLWMCNLAAHSVYNGYNTAFVTLELQREIVNMRIGANMLNVPIDDYEKLTKDQDLLKKKLNNLKSGSLKPLGKLHVKEFSSSTMSANDLRSYLVKAQEILGYKFENVFVDYINIMKNWRNPNTENLYIKIKQISEDLRAVAQEEQWAIISPTQTNRCLDPNSLIEHREKGIIKLKDINIGDFILGDIGFVKVKNKWNIKNTKTYKIKTKKGKEIICSNNHIFPSEGSFKKISELKIGSKIYIKRLSRP